MYLKRGIYILSYIVFKINFIRIKIKAKYLKGLNYNFYCDGMIGNKFRVDHPSAAKELLSKFLDTRTEMLGIPLITDAKELRENLKELRENFVLFATTPDSIKTADDNSIEVEYLKNAILAALESNQKIVLAYEALRDPSVKKALNNPGLLRSLRHLGIFPETVNKEFDVFIEIEENHINKDSFEIEPIGLFKDEIVKEALDLFKRYKDTSTALSYTDDDINLHKIYIRDKDAPTVLFYTDVINVIYILGEIENNIKEGSIKKEDTAKICVFVPPKNQDLSDANRK